MEATVEMNDFKWLQATVETVEVAAWTGDVQLEVEFATASVLMTGLLAHRFSTAPRCHRMAVHRELS